MLSSLQIASHGILDCSVARSVDQGERIESHVAKFLEPAQGFTRKRVAERDSEAQSQEPEPPKTPPPETPPDRPPETPPEPPAETPGDPVPEVPDEPPAEVPMEPPAPSEAPTEPLPEMEMGAESKYLSAGAQTLG